MWKERRDEGREAVSVGLLFCLMGKPGGSSRPKELELRKKP